MSFPQTSRNNSNFECHWADSKGEIIANQNLNLKSLASIVNIFNTRNAHISANKSELNISNSQNCDISGENNKLHLDGELNCKLNGVNNNLNLSSNRNINIQTNGSIGTIQKNINFELRGEKHDVEALGNSNLTIDGDGGNRLSVKGAINHHITSQLPSAEKYSEVEVVANRIRFKVGNILTSVRDFVSETLPQVFGPVPIRSEDGECTANYKIQSNTKVTIDKDNYEVGSFKFRMTQYGPKVHVIMNSALFEPNSLPNNYIDVKTVTLQGVGNQETIKFSGSKVDGNIINGEAHFELNLKPNPNE